MPKICARGFSVLAATVAGLLFVVGAGLAQEADPASSQAAAKLKRINVSQKHLNFGRTTAPVVKSIDVSNPNSQAVAITVSSPSAPFSVTGSFTFTLAPKASQAIGIRFTPQADGTFRGSLSVTGNGKTIPVTLLGKARGPFPTISGITIDPQPVVTSTTLTANASDPSGGSLTYAWTVGGIAIAGSGASSTWTSPGIPGTYLVGLTVTNSAGGTATATATMAISSLSPWPRFRRTIQATALSDVDTSADTGTVKWSLLPPARPSGFNIAPVIGTDGTIYAVNDDGNLYAVNPDGSVKWKANIGTVQNSVGAAVVGDGTVYILSETGTLHAFNSDGTQTWDFSSNTTTGAVPTSTEIGADGRLYFGAGDTLYALDPDGTQRWSFNPYPGSGFFNTPAIGTDGTIYVGRSAPSSGGVVHNVVYALNPNGSVKWQVDNEFHVPLTGPSPSGSVAVGPDGTIYVPIGNIVSLNPDGTMAQSLTPTVGGAPGSLAFGADGTVYDGFSAQRFGGSLTAFNSGGSVKWTFPSPGNGCCEPAIGADAAIGADGGIYFGGNDFSNYPFGGIVPYLYAVNSDGTQRWKLVGPSGAPVIGVDGTLYVAAGTLYAIH